MPALEVRLASLLHWLGNDASEGGCARQIQLSTASEGLASILNRSVSDNSYDHSGPGLSYNEVIKLRYAVVAQGSTIGIG